VIVEGIDYATNLTGVFFSPVQLPLADRLVYEAHDYAWDLAVPDLKTCLGAEWGYIITQGRSFTAPVWVGEFGTCHAGAACVDAQSGQGAWFAGIRRYLEDGDMDWCYWALNGTQSSGLGRALGAEESYGLLDTTWTRPASSDLLQALVALQPATQQP
jgi:endoglucanase